MSTASNHKPPHHTENGFRNTSASYTQHGFKDFLRWVLVERPKERKKLRPSTFKLETIPNDGSVLRTNKSDFTATWIGHSTLFYQMDGINILVDPIWSDYASPVSFAGPKRITPPAIAMENMPPLDIVLITHNHYDHCDLPTLKKLGNKPFYVVPLGVGKLIESAGITNYKELDWGQSIEYKGMEIICIPSQHFSSRTMFDRNKTLWCSFIVRNDKHSICHIGDSGYFPGFRQIGDEYGPFDICALPIGAFEPKWFMGPVHMDPYEAVRAFQELKGDILVPHHWGTFHLADDPFDLPPQLYLKAVEACGLGNERCLLPEPGEVKTIVDE